MANALWWIFLVILMGNSNFFGLDYIGLVYRFLKVVGIF